MTNVSTHRFHQLSKIKLGLSLAIVLLEFLKLEILRPYNLSEMSSEFLQTRRTVCGVVLDASNIFMGHPIIDAIVDVIVDVPWWEVAVKMII
jgi:hypothetical protein